jgi:endoglucanase
MKLLSILLTLMLIAIQGISQLTFNEKGYFEMPGLNVTVFADIYPEGHQTGVTIIQHGQRVVANGDVRLEVSPGQWSPIPKEGKEVIDEVNRTISRELWFPDSSRHLKGFNPITYPDLILKYKVNVTALEGSSFKITVDLDKPLPAEWIGKVGFNIELFPGHIFGKSWIMDGQSGIFPQQPNGPVVKDQEHFITQALAKGKVFTMVPENDLQRIRFETKGQLALYDGRGNHNNGWFIVREELAANKTKGAIEWVVTPNVDLTWKYKPVIQVSQVGYHPDQPKMVVIETDRETESIAPLRLLRITENGLQLAKELDAPKWGQFLRYTYFRADFTQFKEEGMYVIQHGEQYGNPFKIDKAVYQLHVWQPIIDYFLPVQMCHVRVNDHYRCWHDACHLDDALMAPVNLNHFDGYVQGPSTLTKFEPYQQVPGLNQGGWHDAGDYDLRVESQIGTIELLSLMVEEFDLFYDATTVDQANRVVEIHKADGQNDLVQQIEHGLLSVLGGYRALGRLYRGIICPTLDQYVLLGDAAAMTDNLKWDPSMPESKRDDRMVFTEENKGRECGVAAGLAIASRALAKYNPELSKECLQTALELWETSGKTSNPNRSKVHLATQLLVTTKDQKFAQELYNMADFIVASAGQTAWIIGMALPYLNDKKFTDRLKDAVKAEALKVEDQAKNSPFGVPYRPHIWGAGWTIQRFGVEQYYVHKAWPDVTTPNFFMNALSFNLGVHPGDNPASFASGIGSNSVLVAYGVNRADWSYTPGGVVSGTALIRPDLPELKEWPFFWQQTEYVIGGGSTNFMFLVLAVDHYLNKKK